MTDGRPGWRVRLSAAARADITNILRWTSERFGDTQAHLYAVTLTRAIHDLEAGPDAPGARRRDDLAPGLMTLHVTRRGRRGRHLVVYRIERGADPPVIEVVRLLHDSMDLSRHVDMGEDP